MAYSKTMGAAHPGLIIILLDKSWSMNEMYGSRPKKDEAARAVNQVIYELVSACGVGDIIKDRCELGVISYGRIVKTEIEGMISQVGYNPRTLLEVPKTIAGGEQIIEEVPIWVEPEADNGTPMEEAMEKAATWVQEWALSHPDNFPPVVINITDGEPNRESETRYAAEKLMSYSTNDGNALLFNVHIDDPANGEHILPNSAYGLSGYAKFLYDISSELPPTLSQSARDFGFEPNPGARGVLFNAGADNLVQLLQFGTIGTVFHR